MRKGWIETPSHPKDPILTDYRVVGAPEAALLLKEPQYSKTAFHGNDLVRTISHLLKSQPEEVTGGKLIYCSQDPLREGMFIEISLFLQDYHCKLKFVAQTQKVDFKPEMKEMVFSVGMIILAVNRGDLELFSQIIANRMKNG
jgi:hypothetical protein